MKRFNTSWRAWIPAVILCSFGGPATTVHAAPGLLPGTYRCSAYNVSGGGGSCRNMPPLVLLADGSYQFSSSRGRWTVSDGKLNLSESQMWGPGEILGGDAVRFEYDYRGWRHTVTWTCRECAQTIQGAADPSDGAYVGVTLTLQFAQQVGGVTGFAIVPVESARRYTHNGPLPDGAVQGLAWEAGPATVTVATNRNNLLMSGRRYVVFLAWPRESIPVAVMEIPPTDRDYTATLPATLDGAVPAQPDGGQAPVAPADPFPEPPETPQEYPPPPPVTQGNDRAPIPQTGSAGHSGLADFLDTVDRLGKVLERIKTGDRADRNPASPGTEPSGAYQSAPAPYPGSERPASYPSPPPDYPSSGSSGSNPPGYPAPPSPAADPEGDVPGYTATQGGQGATPSPPPPKCNPLIPKYSQAGCVE